MKMSLDKENKPQKLKNLKKLFRKSPASSVRLAIFKNALFLYRAL